MINEINLTHVVTFTLASSNYELKFQDQGKAQTYMKAEFPNVDYRLDECSSEPELAN